jgi:hypothetical protein
MSCQRILAGRPPRGQEKIHDYYEINIGPGGAVILAGANKSFEEYLALVDLARRIESAFE